ncbi:hypothetical protein [Geobacillus sp. E263]|uniref:hypothetical protein n=1 Tax=Geobacillus sp. E263 TaxID=391290 RepID=UPI00117B5FC4|nr:hypothetical protein [Geobacillus sp. E263]
MSAEYVALSFFKTNRIDYYFKKPYIYFPCPHCCEEAKMFAENATWECMECNGKGTLITLMELLNKKKKEQKILQNVKVYNPTKEIQQIRLMFSKLKKQDSAEIDRLYQKVDELLSYFDEKLKGP